MKNIQLTELLSYLLIYWITVSSASSLCYLSLFKPQSLEDWTICLHVSACAETCRQIVVLFILYFEKLELVCSCVVTRFLRRFLQILLGCCNILVKKCSFSLNQHFSNILVLGPFYFTLFNIIEDLEKFLFIVMKINLTLGNPRNHTLKTVALCDLLAGKWIGHEGCTDGSIDWSILQSFKFLLFEMDVHLGSFILVYFMKYEDGV